MVRKARKENTVMTLADDMTRLSEDIRSLRTGREGLKKELAEGNKTRQVDVLETCAAFADTLARRAKRAHAERQKFLNNLKHMVTEQRQDMRANLAAVRRVWCGRPA
jgi:hypothetical protein